MYKLKSWSSFSLGALAYIAPTHVIVASEFLSVEQAQRAAFPQADRFDAVNVSLTPEQQQRIATLAGPQPPHGVMQLWRAYQGKQLLGHFVVDEVIGRQDLITYAVAIDHVGKLGAIEILNYRESHGGEVRNGAWRRQFAGRDNLGKLRFGIDIKNIAGATLSCEHVTQGVRRIVALWQITLNSASS